MQRGQADHDAAIAKATGESSRFLSVLTEYRKAPAATRKRMYLETLETVLPRVNRYVLDLGRNGSLRPQDHRHGSGGGEVMNVGRFVLATSLVLVLAAAGGLLPLVREWDRRNVRLMLAFGTGVLFGRGLPAHDPGGGGRVGSRSRPARSCSAFSPSTCWSAS